MKHCVEADAPFSASDSLLTPSAPASCYLFGVEGETRPVGYGENSWLSSIIVAMLVVIALNINHCRQLFKNFGQKLVGTRQRINTFDTRTTGEMRTLFIIILLLCLSEGILLFSVAVTTGVVCGDEGALSVTMLLSGFALVYYFWQVVVFRIVGYAFADRDTTRQWLIGFNASQVLLSLLLIVPALIALFYANLTEIMLILALVFYVLARFLFIYKGFRIFFTNFSSLLYFILYLCTLEITPLLILRRLALFALRYLELTA